MKPPFFCQFLCVGVLFSFLLACGDINSETGESSLRSEEGPLFVPEYEAGQAIVMTVDALGRMELGQSGSGIDFVNQLLAAGAPQVVFVDGNHSSPRDIVTVGRNALRGQNDDRLQTLKLDVDEGLGLGTWARDFFPMAWNRGGELGLTGFRYKFKNRVDQEIAERLGGPALKSEKFFESGNIYATGSGLCFVGGAGAQPRGWASLNGVSSDLEVMGCRKVVMLPPPVGSTENEEPAFFTAIGHLDLWAKVVSDNTVLLASIDEKFLSQLSNTLEPQEAAQLQKKVATISEVLEEGKAKILAESDMTVVEVPLPLTPQGKLDPLLNAVTVGSTMFLTGASPVAELESEYSQSIGRARQVIEDLGFVTKLIDATALLSGGGGLHCATMQAPLELFASDASSPRRNEDARVTPDNPDGGDPAESAGNAGVTPDDPDAAGF